MISCGHHVPIGRTHGTCNLGLYGGTPSLEICRRVCEHGPKIKAKPVTLDCIHRSETPVGSVECPTCANKSVKIKVFGCTIHGECCIGKTDKTIKSCATCADRTKEKK